MADAGPIPAILVSGGSASARESCIAAAIYALPPGRTAVLMEGIPDGKLHLAEGPDLTIARTAPGCLCCTGNLVMKITLNRLLRTRPSRIFIGVASRDHMASLREILSSPPYSALLSLEPDLSA
ncbi:GTPase [Lacisediminimonas profundi]|uniref:GTPase n=1 Tax=Lacisediminimonas profundi TaxID=2603856 RepID=UPI001F4F75CD|nr:GTPase [Lacisediminimonas profundi]